MSKIKQFEFPFEKITALLEVPEIYERATEHLLRIIKEDRRIERKPASIHCRDLGDYFSMWSNTQPDGGLIAIGMQDDGSFSGCSKLTQDQINSFERAPVVYAPDAKFESKRVAVNNTKGQPDFVLLFWIRYSKDRVVKTSDGKAFVRHGESKKELSNDEIRELEIDRGQVDFELESCGLSYPEGFNEDLIRQFTDGVRKLRELFLNHSDIEILQHRHLGQIIKDKFIPNNTCCLLFAKDTLLKFPGCKIRFLRFDGKHEGTGEKFNAVKDIPIEGAVPMLILEAEKLIEAQLREFTSLGKDGRFYTVPEYPKSAWYEAIVNACCHRSYHLKNMVIFVKMFDDRLVVESPGPFPPLVTPENIYSSHHPRNPHLMDAMFYLDFVKCANEGTRRMKQVMLESNLPQPVFEQKEVGNSSVRVTLQNNVELRKVWIDRDASWLVAQKIFNNLSQDEKRIINYVAEYKAINVSQAVRLLQSNWPAARKMLDGLLDKGILNRNRKPKSVARDTKSVYVLKS
jgi:ATP-dependent DNA helicase RecG